MGKLKVHELAKELGLSSKDIIAAAAQHGIEVKAAQSALEDEHQEVIRRALGKGTAASAPKAEAPQAAPAPKAEEPKAAPAPKAEESQAAPAPKAEGSAQAQKSADAAPKKKKSNIIIINNSQNSRNGGNRPQGNGGNNGYRQGGGSNGGSNGNNGNNGYRQNGGSNNGGNNARPQQRGPIRPLTPPSPTPSVAMVPEKQVQKPRVQKPEEVAATPVQTAPEQAPAQTAPVQSAPAQTAPVQSAPAQSAPAQQGAPASQSGSRPYNNQGNRPERNDRNDRQGGYRNNNGSGEQRGNGGYRQQGQGGNDRQGGFVRRDGSGNGRGGEQRGNYGNNNQGGYRQGQGGQQGGQRFDRNNAGPGRGFGAGGRDNRGGNGQGTGYGPKNGAGKDKNFGGAAQAAPVAQPGRDNRRKNNNDRDKRKETNYEELENNRPGRFIKPEKKKEEVVEEVIKVITIAETITIKDLADKMKMRPADIIKKLFLAGKILTPNNEITYEEAEEIAMEYEILCEHEVKVDVIEEMLKEEDENPDDLQDRPPVVCVMGHVDHGKTSLLDAIRKTNVTEREAGGITQAIGAYTVTAKGRTITFLDTPGHEAFTAMRMRGANATDIAILVVAADDGVMPQTIEAISHAKAAGVEVIVAVNKIDKPSANVDRVKQELAEYELVPEDWGGSTVFAPVSAKSGEGIDNLLEMILLTADVLELKANPDRQARGLVIEAELDKGRGPVATVLVQKGTLHVGDFISAGASYGKVRAMIDDKGRRVKEAGPSTPVEILGLSEVPEAGEVFLSHENDKTAKSFAETYRAENKEKKIAETQGRMSLEDVFSKIKEGNLKELNIIVKADVQGSVEAVKESLTRLSNEEVLVKVIHSGVGAINESDVSLAGAGNAIIIGFNVRPDATAKATAERENVDIRLYDVIYKAIEDVELAMKGMLDPIFEEKIIGHAEVRQVFKASAIGNIAGSYVMDGEITRGCKVRITREGELIHEGTLASLKRFKDDVKEVKTGFECGLVFEGFDKIQEFDMVECYIMVEVPR